MRISAESIAIVKERAKLVDVLGASVPLKRQGNRLVGLCPFHSEKTPSFHVQEEEGRYYCFGCQAHGDVISYVMNLRGLSYVQAIEELAQRFGVSLKYEGGNKKERPLRDLRLLFRINELAQSFFREQFKQNGKEAQAYLKQRGLSQQAEEAFGIGFAPKSWTDLREFLLKNKVPEALLATSGLLRRSPRGELCDSFRGRIMFPVYIDDKRIAGFGGRVLPALFDKETLDSTPKYLNSPETPVYQKSRIFFGLPQAQQAARRLGEIYLVEGYMDVIGVWQFGVKNAVATCGTAVTEKHLERLKHLVKRVIFLFDGDSAGRAGAGKAFPLFVNSGLDAFAVFLPEGEDPDTYALKFGDQAPQAIAALSRVPLLDCYIDSKMALFGVSEAKQLGAAAKGKLCEEVASVLLGIKNLIEQNELIQKASLRLMVDPDVLTRMIDGKAKHLNNSSSQNSSTSENATLAASASMKTLMQSQNSAASANAPSAQANVPSIEKLEGLDKQILHTVMVLKDEIASEILKDASLCSALHPSTLEFIQIVDEVMGSSSATAEQKKESIKTLLENLGDSWVRHWKTSYKMHQEDKSLVWNMYEECRGAVEKDKLNQQIKLLSRDIAQCKDDSQKIELMQLQLKITRQLKERA